GKVVPDREVMDELVGSVAHAFQGAERLGYRGELEVGAEALDHLLALGLEACAQQFQALGRLRRHRVGAQERKHGVRQRATGPQVLAHPARDLLELLEQHGREVDHRTRRRVSLQVRGHVGVVLDRVQIGPRQYVLAGERITILWLVHVPQEHDGQTRIGFHGVQSDSRRSMSAVTSTTPFSVTTNRRASSARSSPMRIPSGISQPSSTIVPRMWQPPPISTWGRMTERSIVVRSSTRTSEKRSDSRTSAPEMMQPPETIELMAVPRRPSSSRMNFAGG